MELNHRYPRSKIWTTLMEEDLVQTFWDPTVLYDFGDFQPEPVDWNLAEISPDLALLFEQSLEPGSSNHSSSELLLDEPQTRQEVPVSNDAIGYDWHENSAFAVPISYPLNHGQGNSMHDAEIFDAPPRSLNESDLNFPWDATTSLIENHSNFFPQQISDKPSGLQFHGFLPPENQRDDQRPVRFPNSLVDITENLTTKNLVIRDFPHQTWTPTAALDLSPLSPAAQIQSTERLANQATRLPRTLKEPTPKDWDMLRPIIYSLSMKHTLGEVSKVLKDKYCYKTSEKMLKDHRRKWNQKKNISAQEMEAIIRRIPMRNSACEIPRVYVHGKPISKVKVNRYRKRYSRMPRAEVACLRSSTPPGLEIHTLLTSVLSMPGLESLSEQVLKHVRDYIPGAFEAKTWISVGDLRHLQMGRGGYKANPLRALSYALDIYRYDYSGKAKRTLKYTGDEMEDFIWIQDDGIVPTIFDCVYQYVSREELKLIIPILKQYAEVAIKILGVSHPVTLVCSLTQLCLEEAESDALPAIEAAWTCAIEGFQQALGPLHTTALHHRLSYIDNLIFAHDPERSVLLLRQVIRECDQNSCSPVDVRPLLARLNLVSALSRDKHDLYQEAAEISTNVIESTQNPGFPSEFVPHFRGWAHYHLGIARMHLGEVEVGERHLNEAISVTAGAFGSRDIDVSHFQRKLESWLRYYGRNHAADVIAN